MNDLFHSITTWSSSLIIIIMGSLFVAIGIPHTPQWKQIRYGSLCLALSYLILGIASLAESIIELSGKLIPIKSQLVLSVSFFQALLFTGTSLSLIRLRNLNIKSILIQLVTILVLLSLLFSSYCFWPSVHPIVYGLTTGAYIVQLSYYTYLFRKEYNNLINFTEQEDYHVHNERIHRTIRLFYVSLGIGIMSLMYVLIPDNDIFTEAFTICYTAYYVYIVFSFITYLPYTYTEVDDSNCMNSAPALQMTNDIVLTEKNPETSQNDPSIMHTPIKSYEKGSKDVTDKYLNQEQTRKPSMERQHVKKCNYTEAKLKESLNRWLKEERYLKPDAPIEDIAKELETDVYSLHDYFLTHKGILFRTWRVMLRIEKAKELLEAHPDIKISELQQKVGFTDKSYFFRRFKQVTGKTPSEYRVGLKPNTENDLN